MSRDEPYSYLSQPNLTNLVITSKTLKLEIYSFKTTCLFGKMHLINFHRMTFRRMLLQGIE